ncbi:MAG: BON domain-containing protein [Gammaproteobacteria bacterium]
MKPLFLYLNLLLLCLLLTQLQGCAAPILVAGVAGGATIANDKRNTRSMVDDQVIETKTKDKIYADEETAKKIHINITSYNGVVLLTGETLSRSLRTHIINITRHIDNVRRVHNEIRVADLTGFSSRTNDSWITSKVKTQMLTTKGFKSAQIKVATETGTVYLMGLVTKKAGNQAAEIARNVSGVKRVVKLFEYI